MKKYVAAVSMLSVLMTVAPLLSFAEDTPQELQSQLDDIEKQIAAEEQALSSSQKEAASYSSSLKKLASQKNILELQIKATGLRISETDDELMKVNASIAENETRRNELRDALSRIITRIAINDQKTLVSSFLEHGSFIAAANDLAVLNQVTSGLKNSVEESRDLEAKLAEDRANLEADQADAAALAILQSSQKTALQANVASTSSLLADANSTVSTIKGTLTTNKAAAAAIRTRIYELLDTGNTHITFEEAVKDANWVSSVTGIEPAFLLSVLTQESNLGKNVGTCNRVGDPPEKNWTVIMKPTRDQEPFKDIMAKLGRSTEGTPVSCPMHDKNGKQIGWGGAMGPAQFIPSTWVGYEDKITAVTGRAADPWDIRDAFLAAAVKLTADGADGSDNGNWAAAMRYFSGSTNTTYRFYGDQVMARAKDYENDIAEMNQ